MIRFDHEANSWQLWLKVPSVWVNIGCEEAREFTDIGYSNISIECDILI